MGQNLFTFREAAEKFCALDRRPAVDVSGVYLQIKGLYDRGLLKVLPSRAAHGASQISETELCRARLLLVLIDLGIESKDLDSANGKLTRSGRRFGITFSLDSLVEAAKVEDDWVMRIVMGRDHLNDGTLAFNVMLVPNWIASTPINEKSEHSWGDPTHPDSEAEFIKYSFLAYLKIPASKLVAPLLKKANA